MGLQNHQWIACTHKDTGKPHIHLIANRIGVDSKVFDTTFVSNRSAKIAEEMHSEMLKKFSEAMIGFYFNQPQNGIQAIDWLLANAQEEIGFGNVSNLQIKQD
jgi:hypothetical protein